MTHSEFLRDQITVCKRNLDRPNVRYPNGRMSHEVEAEHLGKLEDELFDYTLDNGLFNADGQLVAFAE